MNELLGVDAVDQDARNLAPKIHGGLFLGSVFKSNPLFKTNLKGSVPKVRPPMATDEKLPPLGRPLYIQTFLPTSEHIRKRSVLKVETLDDLNSKRLGVSAWEESCEYCDCFLEQCPGHCGSLELPVPIYRVFFVRRLVKILNSICFYCQRLRMPKSDSHYDWIRGERGQGRRVVYGQTRR